MHKHSLSVKMPVITLMFLFCLILFTGCAAYKKSVKENTFEEITEAYSIAIRWGDYELANSFRRDEERKQDAPDLDFLKRIRVSSYELKAVTISSDSSEVQQTVEIQYYNVDRLVEKTLVDRQVWKYDEEEKKWFLQSNLPDFE